MKSDTVFVLLDVRSCLLSVLSHNVFQYVIGKIMIEVIAMFSLDENMEKVMSMVFDVLHQ